VEPEPSREVGQPAAAAAAAAAGDRRHGDEQYMVTAL
jgi:hypothetical protein